MSNKFKGTVGAFVRGRMTNDTPNAAAAAEISATFEKAITSGTGAGAADILFSDNRNLAASTSEDLDLAGGVSDALGVTTTFADVKAIMIRAAAGNGDNIVVGAAAATPFVGPFADATDAIEIPPGGIVMLVHPGAGWAVGAGASDLLKVANADGAAAADYEIIIVGASA